MSASPCCSPHLPPAALNQPLGSKSTPSMSNMTYFFFHHNSSGFPIQPILPARLPSAGGRISRAAPGPGPPPTVPAPWPAGPAAPAVPPEPVPGPASGRNAPLPSGLSHGRGGPPPQRGLSVDRDPGSSAGHFPGSATPTREGKQGVLPLNPVLDPQGPAPPGGTQAPAVWTGSTGAAPGCGWSAGCSSPRPPPSDRSRPRSGAVPGRQTPSGSGPGEGAGGKKVSRLSPAAAMPRRLASIQI